MIFLVRQGITRDDVWFTKDSGACDKIETRKGYTGAIRKMCVVNQKYATPPYLLEALQGSPDGPKQFLLGDDIIAAPVVVEGATKRDIYLPVGHWTDGNTADVYKGPIWLMDYSAPLNTLPYFVRVGFKME
ncbi:maker260 [Drosophila busckii]|uniref:Maker260 n=1 Tax=Drosophila busckii TaxID=30019 RepID=A0A0M4ET10_DROBS|nr:maker260 [Drosophila busckii]